MQKDFFRDVKAEEQEILELGADHVSVHPSFFERARLTLTLDKLILLVLVNITAGVFIFSLGIERGMHLAKEGGAAQPAAALAVAVTDPEPAQAEAPAAVAQPQSAEISPAPAPFPSGKGFTIQLVTYKNEKLARREADNLTAKGHRAFVIPSGKYFQVCIETSEEKAQASRKLSELQSDGYQKLYQGAFVRPVAR
ncbi:MAG: SPOR domain-containing protein [Candidatus Omnitrophica bacterium]|nr:SPOR domain-containing protein [Candidatus Omnitrophota bacterium]